MATYCFETDQKALIAEAAVRAWHTALLDFPQWKGEEEIKEAARRIPDELRSEVSYLPENDFAYSVLMTNAWGAFYLTLPQIVSEREMVQLKARVVAEGRDALRRAIADPGMQEVLDDLYARFQAFLPQIRQ